MNTPTFSSPRARLALAEAPRALTELSSLFASAPLLGLAPRGDDHPVLVMPGFATSDVSTAVLRRYLTYQGYQALPWELGRNLGPAMPGLRAGLSRRLDEIYHSAQQRKVSLVGWSLGGVYARLLAHMHPEKVRSVITLGSPIGRTAMSTASYRIGDRLPNVPSTAIFSKTDAVVPWQVAVERPGPLAENIEVFGSHIGLGVSPTVLYAVADRLALGEAQWRPFQRNGWKVMAYGAARLDADNPAHAPT